MTSRPLGAASDKRVRVDTKSMAIQTVPPDVGGKNRPIHWPIRLFVCFQTAQKGSNENGVCVCVDFHF